MGFPTKCMHFVGSPGRRGYNTPMSGDEKTLPHKRSVRDSQCGKALTQYHAK